MDSGSAVPTLNSGFSDTVAANVLIPANGRFGTDREGYRDMFTVARQWPQRVWAEP